MFCYGYVVECDKTRCGHRLKLEFSLKICHIIGDLTDFNVCAAIRNKIANYRMNKYHEYQRFCIY